MIKLKRIHPHPNSIYEISNINLPSVCLLSICHGNPFFNQDRYLAQGPTEAGSWKLGKKLNSPRDKSLKIWGDTLLSYHLFLIVMITHGFYLEAHTIEQPLHSPPNQKNEPCFGSHLNRL